MRTLQGPKVKSLVQYGFNVVPYKDRILSVEIAAKQGRKIFVHRNLKFKGSYVYSIISTDTKKQVIGYTDNLLIHSVNTKIHDSGKKTAVKTKIRNVHAFLEGKVLRRTELKCDIWKRIHYDPFDPNMNFYIYDWSGNKHHFDEAPYVYLTGNGPYAGFDSLLQFHHFTDIKTKDVPKEVRDMIDNKKGSTPFSIPPIFDYDCSKES